MKYLIPSPSSPSTGVLTNSPRPPLFPPTYRFSFASCCSYARTQKSYLCLVDQQLTNVRSAASLLCLHLRTRSSASLTLPDLSFPSPKVDPIFTVPRPLLPTFASSRLGSSDSLLPPSRCDILPPLPPIQRHVIFGLDFPGPVASLLVAFAFVSC